MSTTEPTVTDEMVEQAAKAMADDWNPDRDPILSAMFRDYAATAIAAVIDQIKAEVLDESLLGPGRARCHAIGPDWDSYHLMSDEPSQCPSAHGRVAPYPPAYDKITKGFGV